MSSVRKWLCRRVACLCELLELKTKYRDQSTDSYKETYVSIECTFLFSDTATYEKTKKKLYVCHDSCVFW